MFILSLLSAKVMRTIGYVVLALLAGMFVYAKFSSPNVVERVIDNTRVVTVEVPVLTEKIVTKFLKDPKDKAIIEALLKQNAKLQADVLSFSQTIAELKQSGGVNAGGVVTVTPPVISQEAPQYTYKDFQLTAVYQKDNFTYDLHQTFEVLSTTGRAKDGSRVGLTNVFQIGKDGKRIPVPAKTTVLFADEATTRWFVHGGVQAGVGMTFGATGPAQTAAQQKGGVVAFQWLKRGKSKSAEDLSFSLLSPAVFFGTARDFGVLPVSINLGHIPRQPFSNLWASPFMSRTRIGIILSATF